MLDPHNLPDEIRDLPDAGFELAQTGEIKDEVFHTKPIGFYRDALQRLRKSKASMVSFWIIVIIILLALIVPNITGYTYMEQDTSKKNLPPKIPGLESLGIADGSQILTNRRRDSLDNPDRFPEGSVIRIVREYELSGVPVVDVMVDYYTFVGVDDDVYHWMGTDYLGRDLCTRLFQGTRVSLLIAFFAVLIRIVIGVIYGAIAGYYGGKVDFAMIHFAEVMDGLPYVVVTILFMILLGAGMFSIILAMTVTGWIGTSRLIRAQFYRFKGREYVLAARTLGVTDRKLIFRHILPNTIGPLITKAMIEIPGAIFSEAFLAYIGLGIKPPNPSIGILLSNGQSVLLQYPYQTLFPAVLISVLMVAFNLFANGLRDALDPTRRGED
ncbi:MAG: ABC transporter permease [Peptococcaceae bacterium]|jgi:oligopeptide transport system permease protein|nr:ABC transporter permease [Peptococcaceae bacterium]